MRSDIYYHYSLMSQTGLITFNVIWIIKYMYISLDMTAYKIVVTLLLITFS